MEEKAIIKKTIKYLCRICADELKNINDRDLFGSFFNPNVQKYCGNKKCKHYGLVTVAAIHKEIIT